ncbi:histidine kinase [Streptomyces sp. NPDC026206]|uniref:sensor histidine kinase n=1 Tax=Streptomyces sp. NPDC026206 TaxID=3157089 RepID=UPI0034066578
MRRRDVITAVFAAATGCAAVIATAVAYGTAAMPYAVVPATTAAALLLWTLACWPSARHRLAGPLALTGALSLATTVLASPPTTPGGGWPRLGETAALLMLLVVVTRWAPLRQAAVAGGLAGSAVAAWSLPLLPETSLLSLTGAAAFWSVPVLGAVVVGGYPRLMEHRRNLLVAEVRRAQQLELARDLHDFVAHDVSGIVAQAQAARFVAATDPRQALPALERIETAGLNALASMDRTIAMLHAAAGSGTGRQDPGIGRRDPGTGRQVPGAVEPLPGVDQLPGLVERFSVAGSGRACLAVAPGATDGLSRATGSTAYRVVVEALTNVRRHAPGARLVEVRLERVRTAGGAAAVEVEVVNDAGTGNRTALRRERDGHGGRGLSGLRERVRAAGGTLSYGPHEGGWRVAAVLPQAPEGAP